jgi:hypothetical protein
MNLNRSDVERIVENMLSDIEIKVTDGGFTDPNSRMITLHLFGRQVAQAWFDVVQKDEYPG